MNDFKTILNEKTKAIDTMMEAYLPKEEGLQETVIKAMNYSVLIGGKRLRPMLMQEIYSLFGGKEELVAPFMAAIEMIHTYSLVHDDLPAMDNDEYRRGKKTTWVVYGEPMAILAGDGLLNFAFETALKAFDICAEKNMDAKTMANVAKAMQVLSKKAGIYGMIGGQTADILAEEKEKVTEEELLFIHENKTAALVQAAMMVGAILTGADEATVSKVEKCAYNIGIAFQIQDDILDIIGDAEELGKPIGSDEKNHKQTYVTLHGLEASKEQVKNLSEEAIELIKEFGENSEFLCELIHSLIYRTK